MEYLDIWMGHSFCLHETCLKWNLLWTCFRRTMSMNDSICIRASQWYLEYTIKHSVWFSIRRWFICAVRAKTAWASISSKILVWNNKCFGGSTSSQHCPMNKKNKNKKTNKMNRMKRDIELKYSEKWKTKILHNNLFKKWTQNFPFSLYNNTLNVWC